jgi:hypothetical protein
MKEMKNHKRSPNERRKKRDPGLVSFLTTYHKTMWTANFNCTFVYEDDNNDIEIGEQVNYNFNNKPVVDFTK